MNINMNNIIKGYALIITLIIMLTCVYRMGASSGEARMKDKVNSVLDAQAKTNSVASTWDVMNDVINPE